MKCDLIEGSADGKPPGVVACESRDWRGLLGEIFAMRQCNASMAGACNQRACFRTWPLALKGARKPFRLRGLAPAPSESAVAHRGQRDWPNSRQPRASPGSAGSFSTATGDIS